MVMSKQQSQATNLMRFNAGIVLPVCVLLALVGVCIVIGVLLIMIRSRKATDSWEMDPSELDIGETLGIGGYGEVGGPHC